MGLDISAYPRTTKATDESDRTLFGNPAFPGRFTMPDGEHAADGDPFSFRAGSYSGYSWWRRNLCFQAFGVSPEELWADDDSFSRFLALPIVGPLALMVNFTDCDGCISGDVAAKIAPALRHVRDNFDEAQLDQMEEGSFVGRLDNFIKAFEIAAPNGVVIFA